MINFKIQNRKIGTYFSIFFIFILSIAFPGSAIASDYEIPLKNCSGKELTAFYYFKSLEPGAKNYEQTKPLIAKVREFVTSKTVDNGKSIQEQLSIDDNLKLNSMLEKIRAYQVRDSIEKIYFRDRAVLIAMIGVVQDEDLDVKELLNKDPNVLALFLTINKDWIDKGKSLKKPFYKNTNTTSCNIYMLSQQIQEESLSRVNANAEEIKILTQEAGSLMGKVNNSKEGIELLSPSERSKYNRMKDVFPKLSKFRNTFDYLERIKAIAYVADLRYQNAVEVWTKNLGDMSTIDKSLERKFSKDANYIKDFQAIHQYLNMFDSNFPYLEFYEKATKSPNDLFRK